MNKRTQNQNLILEGLYQMVDESTLPQDLLKRATPTIKKELLQMMDLETGKVTKVKNTKDPLYKSAFVRIYVMDDEYCKDIESRNGDLNCCVYIAKDESYSWNKNAKWQFFNPRKGYYDKDYTQISWWNDHIQSIYVINKDEYKEGSELGSYGHGEGSVGKKQADRREAKQMVDPHKASSSWYVDAEYDENNNYIGDKITDKKAYISAKVGEKTRTLKSDVIRDRLEEIIKKSNLVANTYRSPYGVGKECISSASCNDTQNYATFYITVTNEGKLAFKTEANKYNIESAFKNTTDAEELLKSSEYMSGVFGDIIRLQKDIEKDGQLKRLIAQL